MDIDVDTAVSRNWGLVYRGVSRDHVGIVPIKALLGFNMWDFLKKRGTCSDMDAHIDPVFETELQYEISKA